MHFTDRLFTEIEKKGSILCVGFDPHWNLIPEFIKKKYAGQGNDLFHDAALAVEDYLLHVLEAIHDCVPVIKPQFAFFEQMGSMGFQILERLSEEAHLHNLLVIGDAKRGDIGSTAAAYASAYFGPKRVLADQVEVSLPSSVSLDAITLNPFLGFDSIQPFLEYEGKGVFILVRTSNSSGGEVQDIQSSTGSVSELVAEKVYQWGRSRIGHKGYTDVGAVVGATYPAQAARLREIMPGTPFLIPGYGHQGGGAVDAVITLDSQGLGGVVNSSRKILFAYMYEPYRSLYSAGRFAEAARMAALDATAELNEALKR